MALSPVGRVSFPNFGGKLNERGDTKYDCVLVFDKEAQESPKFKQMMDAIDAAAAAKFGDKVPSGIKRKSLAKKSGYPVTETAESEDWYGWAEEGSVFLSFSSKYVPEMFDADKEEIVNVQDIYPGCYGRVSYTSYGYDVNGNKGVAMGFKLFQKTDEGERLGGGGSAVNELDEDF